MDKQTGANVHEVSAEDAGSLNDLLEDLVLDEVLEADAEVVTDEVFEEQPEVIEELDLGAELSPGDIMALDAEMTKEEVYAEQESEIGDVDTSTKPAKKAKGKAKNATQAAAAPKTSTPRVARDLNAIDAVNFVLEGDVTGLDQAGLDAAKAATLALRPTQKKIAEKFENLFMMLAANRKPSTFVVDAFRLLDSKGAVSASDVIAAFKAEGYSQGTAASQAGQIMNLFATVRIADRAKNTLTLNARSNVAQRLREVLA